MQRKKKKKTNKLLPVLSHEERYFLGFDINYWYYQNCLLESEYVLGSISGTCEASVMQELTNAHLKFFQCGGKTTTTKQSKKVNPFNQSQGLILEIVKSDWLLLCEKYNFKTKESQIDQSRSLLMDPKLQCFQVWT